MYPKCLQCLVAVLLLATSVAGAQRLLAVPDLSTFTTGGAALSLDPRTGYVYASFSGDRAMGVASSGLARVSPRGVIDAYWRPTGLSYVRGHAVAGNGDVYAVGFTGAAGEEILRYSGTRGGEPLSRRLIRPDTPTIYLIDLAVGQDQWLYFSRYEVGGTSGDTTYLPRFEVNRIDTRTGERDPNWKYSDSTRGYFTVKTGRDGAVYVTGQKGIARLSTANSDSVIWETPLAFAFSKAIAPDARGGLFVVTCSSTCAAPGVMRLDASGAIDRSWNGSVVNQAIPQGSDYSIASVGDSLYVAATIVLGVGRRTAVVTRFDAMGIEQARWSAVQNSVQILGSADGKLYVVNSGSAPDEFRVLNGTTLAEEHASPISFCSGGRVSRVMALADGGHLIFGRFDVWQGGVRYRNFVRTRADGLIDAAWMANLFPGEYFNAEITARGIVMSGAVTSASGEYRVGLRLVSMATGETVDPGWGAALPSFWLGSAFASDHFYALDTSGATATIRRASTVTGVIDSNWTIPLATRSEEEPFAVKADKAGGLWLFWRTPILLLLRGTLTTTIQRYGASDRLMKQTFAATGSQRYGVPFDSTSEHAYIGTRRYDLNKLGALDPTWDLTRSVSADTAIFPIVSGRYLHYITPQGVQRVPLSGNGTADASRLIAPPVLPTGSTGWDALVIAKASTASDDIDYVLNFNSQGMQTGSIFATTRTAPATNKIVVEYFNREAARYFMTGRASEQATLDALPASFHRTGMVFTAKSSEYRDVPEQPVCRFYAAPESGGSNTHFYGTGDDCAVLNTVRQVRFEGFDFAAIKPTNGICPATAPNAVFRLFNNKSASNEGNHRYVVSAATKLRMIAQGWVDEGAVFCSTSVVDAAN